MKTSTEKCVECYEKNKINSFTFVRCFVRLMGFQNVRMECVRDSNDVIDRSAISKGNIVCQSLKIKSSMKKKEKNKIKYEIVHQQRHLFLSIPIDLTLEIT